VAGDAGIVDQHLDRAEIGLDLLEAGGAGVVGGDVPLVDRNAGGGFELLCRGVIAAVVRRDLVARGLQRLRYRFADSARSPRHHLDAWHIRSSLRRTVCYGRAADARVLTSSARRPSSHLSTHIAMPMPPPMQSVARPFFALRFCIS